ncbi:MAG: hypothetical protein FWH19_03815 [Treponema sp.]|nr:hypothetical protein [Treponema sp.]
MKLEERTFKFLELSQRLTIEYPELFPNSAQLSVFRKEFASVFDLSLFARKIYVLKDRISDTETLSGNRVLDFAMDYYNTIRMAARRDIPGTRIVYDELRQIVPVKKQSRRKSKSQEEPRQPELFEN